MAPSQKADPRSPRSSRVWMDVSTSLRNAGQHANGTLRVEREFATALRGELGDAFAFCQYRPNERRFSAVSYESLVAAFEARPWRGKAANFGGARPDTFGRQIERFVRLTIRRFLKRARGAASDVGAFFPEAQAGDVLLLGGEVWNERYDFDVMARLRNERGLKIAAICQDLIPLTHPQFFASQAFLARHHAYIDWLLSNVDLVTTFSQSVRADLQHELAARDVVTPAMAAIPLGANLKKADPRKPAAAPPLVPGGFVIAVSTIQSRKNFDLLYRLWRRFADERRSMPQLVMVGAKGFGGGALLDAIAADPQTRATIVVLHNATDAELDWLYRNCRFTLYPSFAEGWGLPIAESLSYGKPCLASNTTSMPEAGAGLAVHLDPYDDEAWHETIVQWSSDDSALAAMAQAIVANYRPTTWAQSAAKLAEQLRTLLR